MSGKVLSAAIFAAVFAAAPAFANLADPAELPPAGYKGQQYVDSRGCVFLRAGYGGDTVWVPRVTGSGKNREQLCGYPASGGTVEVAEPAPAPAPAPAPEPVAPKTVVMATPEPAPAPVHKTVTVAPKAPAPAPAKVERPVTVTERAATAEVTGTRVAPGGGGDYRLACPASTPVAERFELYGGGSKVLCTRGNGSLDGANFPVLVAGSTAGHPIGYDAHVAAGAKAGAGAGSAGGTVFATTSGKEVAKEPAAGSVTVVTESTKSGKSAKYPPVTPPPGYKLAWDDDRLNPDRGKQTVEGVLDQDEIWTRSVPAELREDWDQPKAPLTIVVRHKDGSMTAHEGVVVSTKGDGSRMVKITGPGKAVTKSTKTEPKAVVEDAPAKVAKPAPETAAKAAPAKATGNPIFVQVGSFGVAANADGTTARLRAAGLPVARGKAKGGALTVVYAGPFTSAAEARAALAAARGMGFGDARIVQ